MRQTNFRQFLRSNGWDLLVLLVPLLLYIVMILPLRHWIIDDAGVTFAYARNFAHGDGLVAQPGVPPVEGFSNLLWLLLMAPFFVVHLFEPHIVPKLVSLVLVGFQFYLIHYIAMRLSGGLRLVSFSVLIVLALNAPFVIWTTSGLENALYSGLIVLLLWLALEYLDSQESRRMLVLAGLVVVGAALTRPEGIVYAMVFPVAALVKHLWRRPPDFGAAARAVLYNLGAVCVGYGGFVLFRWLYFGSLLPNTYYAKGGPSLRILVPSLTLQEPYLTKFQQLSASMFGTKLWIFIPLAAVILITWSVLRKERAKELLLLLVTLFTAYYSYMIMPDDWMGEFRFGIPIFVLSFLLLAVLGGSLIVSLFKDRTVSAGVAGVVLALLFVGMNVKVEVPRLRRFQKNPIVSFDRIANDYAFRFNRYADRLGLDSASVLLPDVGATLYYSKLRVYDMARLTDATIARTLRKKQKAFHDYIFETAKPTFIHMHGNWTYAADLASDDRFRRDYVAIDEYSDAWAKRVVKRDLMSGDYIRRDVVSGIDNWLTLLHSN